MKFEKEIKKLIGMSAVVLLLNACTGGGKNETHFVHGGDGSKPDAEGQATGGGSFGDESSNYILEAAKRDLVSRLRDIGRPMISDLPEGWDIDKIRDVIAKTRVSKNKKLHRYDTELMFNYGVDQESGKPYIEALELFYTTYAGVNINNIDNFEFHKIVSEIRLKLLHEVAHLLGIGLSKETDLEARHFSRDVLIKLGQSQVACSSVDTSDSLEPDAVDFYSKWLKTSISVAPNVQCILEGGKVRLVNMNGIPVDSEMPISELASHQLVDIPINSSFAVVLDPASGNAIVPVMNELTIFEHSENSFHTRVVSSEVSRDLFETLVSRVVSSYEEAVHRDYVRVLYSDLPNLETRFGFHRDQLRRLGNLNIYRDVARTDCPSCRGILDEFSIYHDRADYEFLGLEDGIVTQKLEITDMQVTAASSFALKHNDYDEHERKWKDDEISHMEYLQTARHRYIINGVALVQIEQLVEELKLNLEQGTAELSVRQEADVLCQDGETYPLDTERTIELKCQSREIEPVSVEDYKS